MLSLKKVPSLSSKKTYSHRKIKLDPEEILASKFRAKCNFRALVRRVMDNAYWLMLDIDEYKGDDVKKIVQQAVRSKGRKTQLKIGDKALLNKPAEDRTEKEKRYLYRIIGNFKCFKRYPQHVKKQLAGVAYFKYYGPGRTIVRQNQEAHAIYFIVNGEVTVSHLEWDEVLQEHQSVDIGVMGQGDMFGEVSLLHNIPRTATCTTAGHCELLALMKDDFKAVLQSSVQKQWDEILVAMSSFTYFDSLDEVSRREGCIMAKMKSYETNDTILGDGVGVPNHVYFVLSGQCQMIESLKIVVKKDCGREFYTLYDPYNANEENEEDLDAKYFSAYKKEEKGSTSTTASTAVLKKQSMSSKSVVKHLDVASDLRSNVDLKRPSKDSSHKKSISEESRPNNSLSKVRQRNDSEKSGKSVANITGSQPTISSEMLFTPEDEQENRMRSTASLRYSDSTMPTAPPTVPKNLQTFFMQVCQLRKGATFGFGENMRDRRIIALTPVECMLLPKVWLLQKNTANIWTRIQHYLEKKIPTKKQLFKEFVSAQQWQMFKRQMVQAVVSRNNTLNWTSVHDVPYSVRMEEMVDPLTFSF